MFRRIFPAALLCLLCISGFAAENRFSVPMDYALIRNVMINQLYTSPGETARFWKDGKECSFLDASNPQIGGENGLIKIENDMHARIGMVMAGKCLPLIEWRGMLRTFQKPTLDNTRMVLSFPVTEINAFDAKGQLNIQQLQDLINKVVQPKLANLKIDLNETRSEIAKTLLPFVNADDGEILNDTLNSLRFTQAQAADNALLIGIGFMDARPKNAGSRPDEPPFNAAELQQWQEVWRKLTQNLENGFNKPPISQQSVADKAALREILEEADVAFSKALTETDSVDADPVREYLNDSWEKLGPLLRNASKQLPGMEGLRYLTLIAATDLMYQVEAVTKPLGLEISANGLRKLARAYLAHLQVMKKAG